ncbi:MAG TPA: M67 family metallopeptidase [Bacteroidota bacterium]
MPAATIAPTIAMSHTALHKIRVHAMEAYPEECCGILVGTVGETGKEVFDVVRIGNAREENRTRRFLITPEEYTRAEAAAGAEGLGVMGFYHSHPDHPARPSQFDLEHAWPWCSYVIVAVEERIPAAVKSWVLKDDRLGFDEEIIDSVERVVAKPAGESAGHA